jgi:hypothetical protein
VAKLILGEAFHEDREESKA